MTKVQIDDNFGDRTGLKKRKIMIVDDHPITREGIARRISSEGDMMVCSEAESAQEALQIIEKQKLDLVLLDISLEASSGLDVLKDLRMRFPELHTLILSMHEESLYAERALRAGARGYLMKREAAKKVIQGIRAVLGGQLFVSEKITAMMAERFLEGRTAPSSPVAQLSDRELEVFQLLGRGQTTRQIADHLHVGFKTVQAYCARIKEKLQLANATELLRAAMQWNDNQPDK